MGICMLYKIWLYASVDDVLGIRTLDRTNPLNNGSTLLITFDQASSSYVIFRRSGDHRSSGGSLNSGRATSTEFRRRWNRISGRPETGKSSRLWGGLRFWRVDSDRAGDRISGQVNHPRDVEIRDGQFYSGSSESGNGKYGVLYCLGT